MADPSLLGGFDLPFQEQIDFFRQKLNLPTAAWDDIWQAAHDRAFVVAGATKADLLNDLRQAVDKAITAGTTLETFRKDFRKIVAEHGWPGTAGEGSTGGFNWRTKVIYETNLRTSHAAGRAVQLADPGLQALLPFRRYIHNDSVLNPRPQHLAWHGLTLPHDHPFWKTHTPVNGWGCRCRVTALLKPKTGDKTEPPEGWDEIDEKTGAPVGIDKGWAYAPGASRVDELRRFAKEKAARLPTQIASDFEADVSKIVAGATKKTTVAAAKAAKLEVIGLVSDDFAARCQGVFDKIPAHVRAAVEESGFKTILTDKLVTFDPSLKRKRPRGWPTGTTWDNAEGINRAGTSVVAEYRRRIGGREYMETDRAEATLLHEFGHAFDKTGPNGGSLYARFRAAYSADVARLLKSPPPVNIGYFLQAGHKGRSETFAEIFANLHGHYTVKVKTSDGIYYIDVGELFTECRKVVQDALVPE